MNIHTLKAERSAKQTEMRALAGREAAGETLGDNERARFDALDTETRALEDKLNRAERVAQFERAAHAEPVSGHADAATLERRFSVGKALFEISDNGALTGAELEYSREHRSLTRWVVELTSTRWTGPWVALTNRNRWSPMTSRQIGRAHV